jgi:large subunit ribosomal protein L10
LIDNNIGGVKMPSEKILAKKQEEVKTMVDKYRGAKTIVFADYLGLTVAQDTGFRAYLREKNIDYKVQRNRLLLIALRELGVEGLESMLQGPTAAAMSETDNVLPAKLCVEAEKKFKTFEIKGGVVDGKAFSADDIRALANLPSKEQLVARVLGGLNSPITGFVNVLSANLSGLVRALGKIAENKTAE